MKQLLQQAFTRFRDFVWEDDLRELNVVQRSVVFVLRVLHMLLRELLGGQLNLRAMSLVYTTLLSIVPLLAVSFSVLKGFGVHNKIEPTLQEYLEPLGPKGAEITSRIIGFVENVEVGVLGSLGIALLIYTVIALVQKIEAAFNFVWQVEHQRSFSQRFSNYLSVILVGPVMVFTAVGLTTSMMDAPLARQLFAIEPFGTLLEETGKLLPYFLVCVAFTLVYIFIPNTKVKFRAAAIGGLIAGVLWETTGWVFAMFIASSSKYAAIYSSFAILILLLIWLYLSWLILLVGSQIAFYVQNLQYMTLERVEFVLSNRLRERLALHLMYLIGDSHYHNKPPWSLDQLTARLELPSEPVHRILSIMVDADYLREVTSEDPPVYLPVHDIGTLRLSDMLSRVRAAGEDRFLNNEQLPEIGKVDRLVAAIQDSYLNVLGEQTLKDLVLARDAAPLAEISSQPRPASMEQ
jgi:membrane protein